MDVWLNAGMVKKPVNERTVIPAAKLLCTQLGIFIKERVEINSPTLANAAPDDGISVSYFY